MKRAYVSVEKDQHYASMAGSHDRPACGFQESSRLEPTLILARVVRMIFNFSTDHRARSYSIKHSLI
jgi:hypothetical protein